MRKLYLVTQLLFEEQGGGKEGHTLLTAVQNEMTVTLVTFLPLSLFSTV